MRDQRTLKSTCCERSKNSQEMLARSKQGTLESSRFDLAHESKELLREPLISHTRKVLCARSKNSLIHCVCARSKNSQEYLLLRDSLKSTLRVCEITLKCARSKNSQEYLACVRDQRTSKVPLVRSKNSECARSKNSQELVCARSSKSTLSVRDLELSRELLRVV